MTVEINSKDGLAIRRLVPLATLSKTRFAEICAEINIEEGPEGFPLFNRGDDSRELIYLLSGKVILKADEYQYESIAANSEMSRFALAHQSPRQADGVAETGIRFIRIARELIQNPQTVCDEEKDDSSKEIETEKCSDDWMTTLLKSPIFQLLPAFSLQQILIGLEEVQFSEGEKIIEQGEHGNYYFLVRQGRCMMTRKPTPNAKAVGLGQLQDHDTFGEDSMLSEEPNHYSVTALTDTSLLRLKKEKFITLIKNPSLEYIDYPGLLQEVENGTKILDVRMPDAHNHNHLDGSVNIPFFSLRMQLNSLNRKNKMIVVCENGKISEAAAFLLLKNKFNVLTLNGGMDKVPQNLVHQTATFEITGGTESVIERSAPLKPESDNENNEVSHNSEEAVYSDKLKEKISLLKTENEMLIKSNLQLKKHCGKLKKEKELTEKKLHILSGQTEKYKEILEKFNQKSLN